MVRPFGKLAAVAAAFALCLACLAGCAGAANNVDAAAQNRAYMAQANTAMMQLNDDLVPFAEAAAAGDIVTMEQTAATAVRDMQAFEEIVAPEGMAEIHAEYAAGCKDLRAALQGYVQLYRDSASVDDADFNERIAAIQKQYDEGIAHIQQGDKMVTELNGALPEDSESTAAQSGDASAEDADAAENADAAESSSSAAEEAVAAQQEAEEQTDGESADESAEGEGEA